MNSLGGLSGLSMPLSELLSTSVNMYRRWLQVRDLIVIYENNWIYKHLLIIRIWLENDTMAILGIFKTNAVTKQMYEKLRKEVDWEHQHPDGEALHVAAFDDSGNFCVLISGNQKSI